MARDITQLHPRLQEIIPVLTAKCKEQGISIKIGECYRSASEQDALYAQGRTEPGNIVTNAKGGTYSSMHMWGVAADFYLDMDVDGDDEKTDDAFNNSTRLFQAVGTIGKSLGLEWGGDWTSIVDMPHFQLSDWGSTPSELKATYGTPEKFFTTWGTNNTPPTVTKNYLTKGDSGDAVGEMQKMLIAVGFPCGASGVDERFGADTERALERFQKFYDLTIDGLYGKKSKAKLESVYKTKLTEIEARSKAPTFTVGKTYTLQTELRVRVNAGTDYRAKKHAELTTDGKNNDKDKDGSLDAGTKVSCKQVKIVGDDMWIQTPSGWLAAYYKGNVYIK